MVAKEIQLRDEDFMLHSFKLAPCTRLRSHDWIECPFAHANEKATRRHPSCYAATMCPEVKGGCPRGQSCHMAHSIFEYHLHPARFRTSMCRDATECKRKVCFFAHNLHELRRPASLPQRLLLSTPAAGSAPAGTVAAFNSMAGLSSSSSSSTPSSSHHQSTGSGGSSSSSSVASRSPLSIDSRTPSLGSLVQQGPLLSAADFHLAAQLPGFACAPSPLGLASGGGFGEPFYSQQGAAWTMAMLHGSAGSQLPLVQQQQLVAPTALQPAVISQQHHRQQEVALAATQAGTPMPHIQACVTALQFDSSMGPQDISCGAAVPSSSSLVGQGYQWLMPQQQQLALTTAGMVLTATPEHVVHGHRSSAGGQLAQVPVHDMHHQQQQQLALTGQELLSASGLSLPVHMNGLWI